MLCVIKILLKINKYVRYSFNGKDTNCFEKKGILSNRSKRIIKVISTSVLE